MDVDFAKWYTDVVIKADLVDYSSVRGCMIFRPYGYALWENIQKIFDAKFKATDMRMSICQCLSQKACSRGRRITWRALPLKWLG